MISQCFVWKVSLLVLFPLSFPDRFPLDGDFSNGKNSASTRHQMFVSLLLAPFYIAFKKICFAAELFGLRYCNKFHLVGSPSRRLVPILNSLDSSVYRVRCFFFDPICERSQTRLILTASPDFAVFYWILVYSFSRPSSMVRKSVPSLFPSSLWEISSV